MAVFLSDRAKDLIRSNFFGKDFQTIVNELNDHLLLQFGSEVQSNIVASEFGQYMIEMHAFAVSTAHWYGDRQADDTTLRYARLRQHANVIARQLGYKPSAAVPPAISLTITLDFAPILTRLTIEAGRRLVGPGGLAYFTVEEVVFDVGEVGPKTVTAVEGEVIEEIFTSNGEPNQFFFLETVPATKSISQDSPRTFVNTIEWVEQELLTFVRTDQFEVQYGFNPPRLQFGDGVAGNIPPTDAEIRITYSVTSGPAGAVQANTVTAFQAPLVAGTQVISATLTHSDPSTTGSFREDISSIRINAPLVTQAADRAVTQLDLDAFINSFIDPVFGAVAIGRATVPRSINEDAEAQTIVQLIRTSCPISLSFITATGDFTLGEIITGGTSAATGIIIGIAIPELSISPLSGTFVAGETILGAASLTSATLSAIASSDIADRLETYWDAVLSSNCDVNIVNAQIMSADGTGRYVSAPVGLANALETFLNSIAESTVQVVVTDGSLNLFSVSLAVEVNLAAGFNNEVSRAVVFNNITSVLEGALLGRSYGESLRIGDLYALVEAVDGVVYSHIAISQINGAVPATGALNAFGDLEISDFEVITLGASPTITQI
jgi:hypothetical protein